MRKHSGTVYNTDGQGNTIVHNPTFPTITRGTKVTYTDGQGVEHVDTVRRVNLIPGYYAPEVVSRWYVLTDLKLGVHESAVEDVRVMAWAKTGYSITDARALVAAGLFAPEQVAA